MYREGEIGNCMYFINSGTISVETAGSVVKRGPGDFFGEMSLLTGEARTATVKAATDLTVLVLGPREFGAVIDDVLFARVGPFGRDDERKRRLAPPLARDADDCNIGDTVRITECRPLSALKRWRLSESAPDG